MRGFINVQDRTFRIKLHLHLQISQSQWCEFLFAGGDAEQSSLYLCVGGDVGDTDISFLLLWGGVGGIGERSVEESCASCWEGASTHWSGSRPHDK